MQEELICPYPGLRPFNEDEAIFFKGRDEHIEQITRQLEEKKFLMLTGASGDGKSSLVYAGLIPNARAGFFKAKFGNWIVVDFRPERSPLKNLADALSDKFGAKEKERFQNELQFGFSALIDIYTQSPYYVNKNSIEFLSLEEAEKKKATRKGANLMILVDQFEEFFTNTENYSNGKTSVDSQLVVNLILETSRIALEKDIPIYVVCTMRSDYIGQCASFRGLPEAIGFSQFFVPRLKRNEIYQVIQEPALLNGNKISKRLIEVLINEMNDGIDQLPVLQHALNQVWQIADNGKTEMDLIHFAKIGGLDTQYLTKDDKKIFDDWFEKIPEYKKRFFEHPSLDNVLDGHANDLYYRAYDYLKAKQPDSKITIDDTQLIIRNAFKCLTKIDQSRGVRNRMTLNEIVNIIDKSHITEKEVATVLEIFRLQGNTFLKPFYTEGGKENDLYSDSVLDITHESLIRNWSNLIEWAHEEDEDYHIWLDFEKQLHRWIENDKSNGYLLPIGPLNFFETWMTKKNPNKYWLVKYDESDLTSEEKLKKAETLLKNAKQFIKRSARKLFVSRTVLKYGAQRIAIILSSIMVSLSCIYLYFDYASKENKSVLLASENKGIELLSSSKVKSSTKAQFILLYEETHPGTLVENLKLCGNDSVQIRTTLDILNKINSNTSLFTSKKETIEEATKIKMDLIEYLYEYALPLNSQNSGKKPLSFEQASRLFWLVKTIENAENAVGDSTALSKIEEYKSNITGILYDKYIIATLDIKDTIKNPELFNVISYYFIGLRFENSKLEKIVNAISPFDSTSKSYFNLCYPKNSSLSRDDFSLKYNGGYELLASLYSYLDKDEYVFRCIDSINSYDNKYSNRYNYGYKQIAVSHWLGSKDTSHSLIEKLAEKRIKISGGNLDQFVGQLSFESLDNTGLWANTNDLFLSKSIMYYNYLDFYVYKHKREEVFQWYQKRLWKTISDPNEVHFLQANIFKFRASLALGLSDTATGFKYMDKFKALTETIDLKYLSDSTSYGDGSQQVKTTRRALLFYPGYLSTNYPWRLTNSWSGSTSHFYEYYNKWKLFEKYDFTDNELQVFTSCIYNDINWDIPMRYFTRYNSNRAKEIFDYCHSVRDKFKDKDKRTEMEMLSDLMRITNPVLLFRDESKELLDSVTELKYLNKNYYNSEERVMIGKLNILKLYLFKLVRQGKMDKVFKFLDIIENKVQMNNTIFDVCDQAITYGYDNEAMMLIEYYIRNMSPNRKPSTYFYLLTSQIGGFELMHFSYELMKDSDEGIKPVLLKYMIRGMAQKSEYYQAMKLKPESVSSNSELQFINEILRAEFVNNHELDTQIEKSWLANLTLGSDRLYESSDMYTCYCTNDE